jgi:transaldolase
MGTNPLKQLEMLGQSIWLDYIRRDMIMNGELYRMIEDDGLSGMTSNPAIFEKAITGSHEYDRDIQELIREGKDYKAIYESISIKDVQSAADIFRPVYDKTKGRDGYVSLEVNPNLAFNTSGTIEEARRLWITLQRPNVFIKVPATDAGIPVISQLISEGINVNVTLLFGLPRYREVMEAYRAGIEERLSRQLPIQSVASVASFFVSRIDGWIDPKLEKIMREGGEKAEIAGKLHHKVAIANARVAYYEFEKNFNSDLFRNLSAKGAQIQRLLWASTSTKNPDLSDVLYVESLIGPDTINTIPMETFKAYKDHGDPQLRIDYELETAHWVLDQLSELGIDYDQMTQQLENEGVKKFVDPFNQLLESLAKTTPIHA